MATPNYNALVQKIIDWANRTDLETGIIGDFLDFTAKKIYNVLRIPPLEHITTHSISVESKSLQVPSDMIEVIRIRTLDANNNTDRLYNIKQDSRGFDDVGYRNTNEFTRIGGNFEFSPVLPEGTKLEIYYYRLLPKLDAEFEDNTANQEAGIVGNEVPNWLKDESEELLIYGALSELWGYQGDTDQEQKWKAKFQEKLSELQSEENMRKSRGGTIVQNIKANGLI